VRRTTPSGPMAYRSFIGNARRGSITLPEPAFCARGACPPSAGRRHSVLPATAPTVHVGEPLGITQRSTQSGAEPRPLSRPVEDHAALLTPDPPAGRAGPQSVLSSLRAGRWQSVLVGRRTPGQAPKRLVPAGTHNACNQAPLTGRLTVTTASDLHLFGGHAAP
jgi:hypothetical protein